MSLKQQYKNLWNFLASYFPDADLEGLSDTQASQLFAKQSSKDVVDNVLSEINKILASDNFPAAEISDATNRLFENSAEAKNWLRQRLKDINNT